jgi:hypothetical protein
MCAARRSGSPPTGLPPLVLPPVVQVYPDAEALAVAAAERMARILAAAVAERGAASLALCGGSTPRPAYERLAQISTGGAGGAGNGTGEGGVALDWSRVDVYWGDDRAVPPDHPASNYSMAPPEAALAAAWILATGPGEELLDGQRALELGGYAAQRQVAQWREVVAAALARSGSYDEAAQLQQEAVDAARNEQHRAQLVERLELYRAGKPYTRP